MFPWKILSSARLRYDSMRPCFALVKSSGSNILRFVGLFVCLIHTLTRPYRGGMRGLPHYIGVSPPSYSYLKVWLAWHLPRLSLIPCPSMICPSVMTLTLPWCLVRTPPLTLPPCSTMSAMICLAWFVVFMGMSGVLVPHWAPCYLVTNRLPPLPLQGWLCRLLWLPCVICTDTARL